MNQMVKTRLWDKQRTRRQEKLNLAKEKGFENESAWVDKNGESRGNDVTFLENSGFKGCNTWLFGENYWSAL